jgi:hyperosmotically inducible periplasmic protein
MSIRRALAFSAALAVAIAAASCRPNQSLEGQAKDAQIKTAVKAKLASQVDATTLTSIEVNVTNGVVTLAGPVHSAEESSRIESVARTVEGVTDVKNALQILAPQQGVTPPAITPAK